MILRDQRESLSIRSPALSPLLLDLLEQEHIGPITSHMSFGILLELRVDLLQILITITTLFRSAFPSTESIQHFGHHFPHTRMILPVRLECALYAFRFYDIQQRHRLGYIEVTFRSARCTLMVIAARDRRGRFGLLQESG